MEALRRFPHISLQSLSNHLGPTLLILLLLRRSYFSLYQQLNLLFDIGSGPSSLLPPGFGFCGFSLPMFALSIFSSSLDHLLHHTNLTSSLSPPLTPATTHSPNNKHSQRAVYTHYLHFLSPHSPLSPL